MAKLLIAALLATLVALVSCGSYRYGGHGYGHHDGYDNGAVAHVYVDQNPYGYAYTVDEHGPYHSKYIRQSASTYGHGHSYH